MRAYQKYMRVFGVKGFEHPDCEFVTEKGTRVILVWNKTEYRAFEIRKDGSRKEMLLGSTSAKNLATFIKEHY